MKNIPCLLLIFWMTLITGCYYDNKEYLYPEVSSSCDTTNVTFSNTIKPVLNTYCYTCHSNATYVLGNGIKLEDYPDVKVTVDNGKLLGSISHTSGFSPMPKGGGKLQACIIRQFETWITAGSENN